MRLLDADMCILNRNRCCPAALEKGGTNRIPTRAVGGFSGQADNFADDFVGRIYSLKNYISIPAKDLIKTKH